MGICGTIVKGSTMYNIIALVGLWQGFFIVVESIFIIAEVFKILEKN